MNKEDKNGGSCRSKGAHCHSKICPQRQTETILQIACTQKILFLASNEIDLYSIIKETGSYEAYLKYKTHGNFLKMFFLSHEFSKQKHRLTSFTLVFVNACGCFIGLFFLSF